MRSAFASVAIGLLLVSVGIGCSDDSSSGPDRKIEYQIETGNMAADSIKFEAVGGGDIEFKINDTIGFYRIWLTRLGYRDTAVALQIQKKHADSLSRNYIGRLLHASANISGVIYVNEAETGAWSYLYIHADSKWIRVANDSAIEAMIRFSMSMDSLLKEPLP